MRYNEQQIDSLAAEYVLGTLQGAARRRFDRLMAERADARFAVWRWERELNGLASALRPRAPRGRVWQNISRRIEASKPLRPSILERWRGWWLAVPAAAVAALLAIAILPTTAIERAAIFADQDATAIWVVSADLDNGLLRTEVINAPESSPENSFELWILRDNNLPPLSLGLLPLAPGQVESRLSAELLAALAGASRLAISLEPAGGSPTGLPTGPVLYQATLVPI
ncbi:MAG: anti-sigma factor [Woeseiaceae bacterium]|nr:anti-sigma factor [Woeseiaceae bacterium]